MKKMTNNFLQDKQGNKSSKRLWGSILLAIAIIFSSILFYFSLSGKATDPNTANSIINMFFISGGSLLGIGTFEQKK